MSANLYWEPTERKKNYFAGGSSMVNRFPKGSIWDKGQLNYLRGLLDGGIEEAQALIDAIEKYGSITISVEY